MADNRATFTEEINRLAQIAAESVGVEVVRARFYGSGSRKILEVTINKEGGVTVEDCATFSRAFSPILDQEDLIKGRYFLEVQSPGI